MYLAQNLSFLAKKFKFKNFELAEKIGVSSTQVGHYMKGKGYPRIEGLVALAKLFDVNVHDLILVNLEEEEARPFDHKAAEQPIDEQTELLNKLLMQRVLELEREMKENNPELAKKLGIE